MNMPSSLRRFVRSPVQKAIAIGDSHRDAREWAQAAKAYGEAVELAPSRAAIWVQYGHALKESGNLDGAETAYRQSLALDGANADTHLQLGHLLKISGRSQEAATSYLQSLEITPAQPDALREIQDLGAIGVYVPAERLQAVLNRITASDAGITPAAIFSPTLSVESLADALDRLKEKFPSAEQADISVFADTAARIRAIARAAVEEDGASSHDVALIFDASDLIHHFRHSRVPTGIQRVQLEIIASLIRERREPVRICSMFRHRWVEIPAPLFATLVQLSAEGSDISAADWRAATTHLEIVLGSAAPLHFPVGACLVNLGTSWHVDYLLQVRNAKRESRIRYIPFVHDLIPIVASRFVLENVTQDFVGWLLAVFDHADLFLTNSQSTRRDLIAQAKHLGYPLAEEDVVVIPLDARFSSPPDRCGAGSAFLRKRGLLGQAFVLMVGTIEPRKNHLAAIDAWAELLTKSDGQDMPKLVCVGGRGWLNEDVIHRVSANAMLSDHVLFLHDLSDVELAACYDACLFTIYPSFYEGWGLPVTESLCHGKVPLLSDTSSLPEAGGVFAEYFPIGVQPALVAALDRLIHDSDHRRALERKIAAEFEPRTWHALAAQIAGAIRDRFLARPEEVRDGVPEIRLGSYYSFARSDMTRLRYGLVSGETLRSGQTWHTPESWGCWTSSAAIELALRVTHAGAVRCFIGVKGLPGRSCRIRLAVDDKAVLEVPIASSETRWLSITLTGRPEVSRIGVWSDHIQNLALVTDGADNRVVGPGLIGFYACSADNIAQRLAFIEAASIGVLVPGPLLDEVQTPPAETSLIAPSATDPLDVRAEVPAICMPVNPDERELTPDPSCEVVTINPACSGQADNADRPEWWQSEGMRYLGVNDLAAANAAFRRSLDLAPENAWAHFQLGAMAISAKRLNDALRSFTRAHSIDPGADEISINLGNAMLLLERWHSAAALLAPMGENLGGWWASVRATALQMYREGRERTLALLRQRREGQRDDRALAIELAGLLAKLGRFKAARALCATLMRDDPTDFSPFVVETNIVAEIDGLEGAVAYLNSLSARFSGIAAFEVMFARFLYDSGRFDEALNHSAEAGNAMDCGAHGYYLIAAERWNDLAALARRWMQETDDTRPFSLAIRAGRGLRRLRMLGDEGEVGPANIPRTIVQFWSQDDVPEDVARTIATWRKENPDYRHMLFNDRQAATYIAEHFERAARAFALCRHPAMKSDFFRICFILREGGFYVDADDACVRPLDDLREAIGNANFVALLSSDSAPYVFNGFLAGNPGNRIMHSALDDMVERIEQAEIHGQSTDIWHTTGPGLITRAVSRWFMADQTEAQDALFLTPHQYNHFAREAEDLNYKSTAEGNWRLA